MPKFDLLYDGSYLILTNVTRGEALMFVETRIETGLFNGEVFERAAVNVWKSKYHTVEIRPLTQR